jgi:RNA polymerase sigma factor (sigma-70 family)
MTALPDWDIATDAQLACSAAAGDRAAFAGIYDRYADRLHDFCIGMVRDRDMAADCVQEVFCTAATQLPTLREPDKLRPWLYAIARREALRCINQRSREHVSDEVPEAASGDPDPETLAARTELADLIAQAAQGLSDRDRSVLELAYRHGLDGPELAEALGVSAGNANKLVSRLRQTIEHSLGALLVARQAQHNPDGCPELGAILAGWDGRFSVLMRKRIARHIQSCPDCDQDRRRLVNPVALLGAVPVFIPAPDWLRERTLDQIHLTATNTAATSTASPTTPSPQDAFDATPGSPANTPESLGGAGAAQFDVHQLNGLETLAAAGPPDLPTTSKHGAAHHAAVTKHHDAEARARRTRRLLLLALLLTLITSAVPAIAWLHQHNTTITPTNLTATTPTPTSTQPVTTAASPNNPPPPPAATVDTPTTSIATEVTSSVWAPTSAIIPTASPAPPPPTTTAPTTVAATTTPRTTAPTTRIMVNPPTTTPPANERPAAPHPAPKAK